MMNKEKAKKIYDLVYRLRYQFAGDFGSTYSECAREECKAPARGGRTCRYCLISDLEEIIGTELTHELYKLLSCEQDCRIKSHELIEAVINGTYEEEE